MLGQRVFDVGGRIGDYRKAGRLAAGTAGGGHHDTQRFRRTGHLLVHVADGLRGVDRRTASHCQHRVRLVVEDADQSLYHQVGVRIRRDIRKNAVFRPHLLEHPQQLFNHPGFLDKGVADDAHPVDRVLLQIFKSSLTRKNLGRHIKSVHRSHRFSGGG